MHNHAPNDYKCPFCLLIAGIENEFVLSKQNDIFYQDEFITAFIASSWWPNNSGHVLIVPNQHYENIYDLPDDFAVKIHQLEKRVTLAIKDTYKCQGVSSRQHNEPAGNQDVWHYHLHIFPRYENDQLYQRYDDARSTTPEERAPFAEKLRKWFKNP